MKTVFYFTADWCSPCKKVKPIVEELNREQDYAKFQIIDADTEMELVKRFEIRSVPTFILMEDGVEVNRIIGAQTRESLVGFIHGE
jgi:thioredoxin 1